MRMSPRFFPRNFLYYEKSNTDALRVTEQGNKIVIRVTYIRSKKQVVPLNLKKHQKDLKYKICPDD